MKRQLARAIPLAFLLAPWFSVRTAQCGSFEEVSLFAGEAVSANHDFGEAVALDGNVALVGVGRGASFADGAYVFRLVGEVWEEEAHFTSAITDPCDFGDAVALEAGVAVVGDWSREVGGFCKGPGAVSVYRYDGAAWNLEQELIGPNGVLSFGYALALRGSRLVGGAPGQNPPVQRPPAVLEYRHDGESWSLEANFAAADSVYADGFGEAVALSEDGNRLVVGAPRKTFSGMNDVGAAYVFRHDGTDWIEEQKLLPNDPESLAKFGTSVSIAGDAIAIGCPRDDVQFQDAGSVYLFRRVGTQWVQQQNFAAPAQVLGGLYGWSVSLDGDGLVVGERGARRAHHYVERAGLYLLTRTLVPGTTNGSSFGYSVFLDGERCLVGARFANLQGSSSGAAFAYRLFDLSLGHAPPIAQAGGDPLSLFTCGGEPGGRNLIALLHPDAPAPLRSPALGAFGGWVGTFVEGRHGVTVPLSPALAGRTLRFQAFGEIGAEARARSNVIAVPVQ